MQGQAEKKKKEEDELKRSLPVEKHMHASGSMTEGLMKEARKLEDGARKGYEKSVAIAKKEILLKMSRAAPSQKKQPPKKKPPRPFMDPPKK